MPERDLHERARALPWPMSAPGNEDPVPGELWQVAWGDVRMLVLCLTATAGEANVAPAQPDDTGDERTMRIDSTNSSYGADLAIWLGLARDVPFRVFRRRLGAVTTGLQFDAAESVADGWPPILDVRDQRAVRRADLEDRMEVLEQAAWAATHSGVTLRDAIPEARPGTVASVLGLLPGDVTDVFEGRQFLAPEQADQLAGHFGVAAGDVRDATVFRLTKSQLSELDRPRNRRVLHLHTELLGLGEEDVVRTLFEPELAVAARTDRHEQVSWSEIIDRVLHADER